MPPLEHRQHPSRCGVNSGDGGIGLAALLNAVGTPALVTTPEGAVLAANEAAARLLAVDTTSLRGRHLDGLDRAEQHGGDNTPQSYHAVDSPAFTAHGEQAPIRRDDGTLEGWLIHLLASHDLAPHEAHPDGAHKNACENNRQTGSTTDDDTGCETDDGMHASLGQIFASIVTVEGEPDLDDNARIDAVLRLLATRLGMETAAVVVQREEALIVEHAVTSAPDRAAPAAETWTPGTPLSPSAPAVAHLLSTTTPRLLHGDPHAPPEDRRAWAACREAWDVGAVLAAPLSLRAARPGLFVLTATPTTSFKAALPEASLPKAAGLSVLEQGAASISRLFDRREARAVWSEALKDVTTQLFQTQDLMGRIVDMADEAIITLDAALNIVHVNHGAEAIFGAPADTIQAGGAVALWPAETSSQTLQTLMATAITDDRQGPPPTRHEVTARRANGEIFPAEAVMLSLPEEARTLHTLLLRDITVRKEIEHTLQDAREQADRANRAKSQFLATISHDLRTPLNAVIGFAEMMEQETLGPLGTPQYADFAQTIRQSGEILLSSINDIIDLARLEMGTLTANPSEIKLHRTLEALAHRFMDQAQAACKTLAVDLPHNLPPLEADPQQFKRMVGHLISNALTHTPSGCTVHVNASKAGAGLKITVCDNGPGMSPERLPLLLTPFTSGDDTFSRAQQRGSGLGLPLVQALIELHSGRLDIDTAPGCGTRAHLIFPPACLCAPATPGT